MKLKDIEIKPGMVIEVKTRPNNIMAVYVAFPVNLPKTNIGFINMTGGNWILDLQEIGEISRIRDLVIDNSIRSGQSLYPYEESKYTVAEIAEKFHIPEEWALNMMYDNTNKI